MPYPPHPAIPSPWGEGERDDGGYAWGHPDALLAVYPHYRWQHPGLPGSPGLGRAYLAIFRVKGPHAGGVNVGYGPTEGRG